jgi:hypothetical protein
MIDCGSTAALDEQEGKEKREQEYLEKIKIVVVGITNEHVASQGGIGATTSMPSCRAPCKLYMQG